MSAVLGPFPDLACTGLTSTVNEELIVAAMGSHTASEHRANLPQELEVERLLDREISALSGGEAVRVSLASLIAQGIKEIHIDAALEQLDQNRRRAILSLLTKPKEQFFQEAFIVDNHLSAEEIGLFDERQQFASSGDEAASIPPSINPTAAAELVHTEAAPIISVEQVSFSYNRLSRAIFNQVSLTLEPTIPYFLTGDNGAGKTTFVKLLSGTLLPRKGIIRVGTNIFQPSKSRYRFASIAFQNPDFQWTVQTVAGELKDTQKTVSSSYCLKSILPIFGIPEDMLQMHPNELPFVLKKRLGIALPAISDKPWLIFDEPTLGQDKRFRDSFAEFIQLILNRGAGVIMISHDTYFRSIFSELRELRCGDQKIATVSR